MPNPTDATSGSGPSRTIELTTMPSRPTERVERQFSDATQRAGVGGVAASTREDRVDSAAAFQEAGKRLMSADKQSQAAAANTASSVGSGANSTKSDPLGIAGSHLVFGSNTNDRTMDYPLEFQPKLAGEGDGSMEVVPDGNRSGAVSTLSSAATLQPGSERSDETTAGTSAARFTLDIESGEPEAIDKRKLGITEFGAKIQRAAIIDAVKTHAVMLPMLNANPASNTAFQEAMNGLLGGIRDHLGSVGRAGEDSDGKVKLTDVESGLDLTHISEFKAKLEKSFASMTSSLAELQEANNNFLDYKARQLTNSTTLSDNLQRNVFGKELHAVFSRSALQSILVVGATAGFQVGTVKILQNFFEKNPDQIPGSVLDDAREALGEGASKQDVINKAIDNFVAPGSTYLDENTASTGAIYGAEAAVGGFRGVVVPMADSVNETDARAKKVESAIADVRDPKEPLSASGRARQAMGGAWKAQVKANLVSGAIAAGVQTLATGNTTGSAVFIEVAKTLGFSMISAGGNVAADGIRKAAYNGENEAVSQSLKAVARVGFRGVSNLAKTGVSYTQSAASGELDSRSFAGDMVKSSVQVLASGGLKEALGSLAQNSTSSNLPPNEVAALAAGRTIGTIAEFSRDLNSLTYPKDLGEESLAHRDALHNLTESVLAGVLEANTLDFETVDFDASYRAYASQLNEKIGEIEASQT